MLMCVRCNHDAGGRRLLSLGKTGIWAFAGFMSGWMNWVVSWVDVSIYPVLAAYYLGYFIPALREGATIGGVFVDSTWLSSVLQLC